MQRIVRRLHIARHEQSVGQQERLITQRRHTGVRTAWNNHSAARCFDRVRDHQIAQRHPVAKITTSDIDLGKAICQGPDIARGHIKALALRAIREGGCRFQLIR